MSLKTVSQITKDGMWLFLSTTWEVQFNVRCSKLRILIVVPNGCPEPHIPLKSHH